MSENGGGRKVSINKKKPFGLLKFFRKELYLDSLLNGYLYLNTPEYYRNLNDKGVGDVNESCVHSYSILRDRYQEVPKILINGSELSGLTSAILKSDSLPEGWLQCWFVIDFPKNSEELIKLTNDINKVRNEFGNNYLFLPSSKSKEYANRLQKKINNDLQYFRVKYSDKPLEHSIGCKKNEYSYQREFRFIFDQCHHNTDAPLKIHCDEGFNDLMFKNPILQIVDEDTGYIHFNLDSKQCYSSSLSFEDR